MTSYAANLQSDPITGAAPDAVVVVAGAVPDGFWDDEFIDGGAFTAHAPTVGALSFSSIKGDGDLRHFLYDKIYISPESISAGAISRTKNYEVKIWNASFLDETLTAIAIPVAGISIDDGSALPDSFAPLGEYTYDLEIAKIGPASFGSEIVFSFTDFSPVLEVSGFRAQLWAYWAQTNMSESLEPMAWIFTATDGTEQRSKIRDIPRRRYGFECLLQPADWRIVQRLLAEKMGINWIVPAYHEAQFVSAAYLAGDTVIAVDTTAADYYVGGFVMIWKSPTENHVSEIESLTSSSITLADGLATDLSGSLRIVPVVTAKMGQSINSSVDPVGNRTIKLSGEVVKGIDLTGYSAPHTFEGYDIFEWQCEGRSVDDSYSVDLWDTDFDIGVIDFGTRTQRAKLRRGYDVTLMSPAELWKFRKFIHAHHNAVPFWFATQEADAYHYGNLLASSVALSIVDNGFYQSHAGRASLFIEYPDGTIDYRKITGVSFVSESVTTLSLNAATSNASTLAASSLKIGFLVLARMDGAVSFKHSGYKSDASFKLIEVYA